MKRLTISIILIISIITVASLTLWDLNRGITELQEAVEDLRQTSTLEHQQLIDKSNSLLELWNSNEDRFVLYVNHGTLDHITQIVAELPALAQYGDFSHLYSKADSISALLDDLWKSSLPTYRTLL